MSATLPPAYGKARGVEPLGIIASRRPIRSRLQERALILLIVGSMCIIFITSLAPIEEFYTDSVANPKVANGLNHLDQFEQVANSISKIKNFVPPDPVIYITKPQATKSGCSLVDNNLNNSTYTHHHAKMRFIIFQRDAGQILQDLIAYYTQVVPLDSLVIIDHLGEDSGTQEILSYFQSKGMHVWRCEGDWDQKGEMWSDVTRVYSQSSDFVFPLDVDEYLAVAHETKHGIVVEWSQSAFLEELESNIAPSSRNIFKTVTTRMIPPECPISLSLSSSQKEDDQAPYLIGSTFSSPVCAVRQGYVQFGLGRDIRDEAEGLKNITGLRQKTKHGKVFTRGSEFGMTDTGNHLGALRNMTFKEMRQANVKHRTNPEDYPSLYFVGNFVLLHMSDLNYHTWIAHFLRGTSSRGYNNRKDCVNVTISGHYCHLWVEMQQKNMSYYKMKEIFLQRMCPKDPKSLSHRAFSTIDVFRPLCD